MPKFSRPYSSSTPVGKGFRHSKDPGPNPHAVAISPFRHGRKLSDATKKRIQKPLLKSAMIKAALGMGQPGGVMNGLGTMLGWGFDAAAGRNRTNTQQPTYNYSSSAQSVRDMATRLNNNNQIITRAAPLAHANQQATDEFTKHKQQQAEYRRKWEADRAAYEAKLTPEQKAKRQQQTAAAFNQSYDSYGSMAEAKAQQYQPGGSGNEGSWVTGNIGRTIDPKSMEQSFWSKRPSIMGDPEWATSQEGLMQKAMLQESGFSSLQEAANAYHDLDLSKPLDQRGQQAYLAQLSMKVGQPVTPANMAELTGMEFGPDGKALPAATARYQWADRAAKERGMNMDDFVNHGYRVGANGSLYDPEQFGSQQYNRTMTSSMLQYRNMGMGPEMAAKYTAQDMANNGVYVDPKQLEAQYEKIMGKGMYADTTISDAGLDRALLQDTNMPDRSGGVFMNTSNAVTDVLGDGPLAGGLGTLAGANVEGQIAQLAGRAVPVVSMANSLRNIVGGESDLKRRIAHLRPDMVSPDERSSLFKGTLSRLNPMDKDNYANSAATEMYNRISGNNRSALDHYATRIQSKRDKAKFDQLMNGDLGSVMELAYNAPGFALQGVNGLTGALGDQIYGVPQDASTARSERAMRQMSRIRDKDFRNAAIEDALSNYTSLGMDPDELRRQMTVFKGLNMDTPEGAEGMRNFLNSIAGNMYTSGDMAGQVYGY